MTDQEKILHLIIKLQKQLDAIHKETIEMNKKLRDDE